MDWPGLGIRVGSWLELIPSENKRDLAVRVIWKPAQTFDCCRNILSMGADGTMRECGGFFFSFHKGCIL